ncbi:Transcription Factor Spt20 [Manis pentadactyla]|nr:Transcription Factor Spt20 [Manis pentadactyla]
MMVMVMVMIVVVVAVAVMVMVVMVEVMIVVVAVIVDGICGDGDGGGIGDDDGGGDDDDGSGAAMTVSWMLALKCHADRCVDPQTSSPQSRTWPWSWERQQKYFSWWIIGALDDAHRKVPFLLIGAIP